MLGAILAWIIIGGIAGWLASLLVQGGGMGIVGDIVVGIIGGIVGGLVLGLLGLGGDLAALTSAAWSPPLSARSFSCFSSASLLEAAHGLASEWRPINPRL
jgi:uncharacterized membrane protein YeaQ/YmgE (transglycosylase-associated protein family)